MKLSRSTLLIIISALVLQTSAAVLPRPAKECSVNYHTVVEWEYVYSDNPASVVTRSLAAEPYPPKVLSSSKLNGRTTATFSPGKPKATSSTYPTIGHPSFSVNLPPSVISVPRTTISKSTSSTSSSETLKTSGSEGTNQSNTSIVAPSLPTTTQESFSSSSPEHFNTPSISPSFTETAPPSLEASSSSTLASTTSSIISSSSESSSSSLENEGSFLATSTQPNSSLDSSSKDISSSNLLEIPSSTTSSSSEETTSSESSTELTSYSSSEAATSSSAFASSATSSSSSSSSETTTTSSTASSISSEATTSSSSSSLSSFSSSLETTTTSSTSISSTTSSSSSLQSPTPTTASSSSSTTSTSSSTTSTSSSTTSTSSTAATSTGFDFEQVYLDAHNELRSLHEDTPVLAWDSGLAAVAQGFADEYTCNGAISHSGNSYNGVGAGENLAYGYSFEGAGAVAAWYSEIEYYNYSDPGYSSATGHFTQLVWKSSTILGCGYKNCGSYYGYYVVCNYQEQGNLILSGNPSYFFVENVKPLKED